jgi:hypothetical protein
VVGVFLVYHAIYWYRRALVVVEREEPPLTAPATPVQSKIAAISDVEGAVGIALLNCTCINVAVIIVAVGRVPGTLSPVVVV